MKFFTQQPAWRLSFATVLLFALSEQKSLAAASSTIEESMSNTSGIVKETDSFIVVNDSVPVISHAGTTLFCAGTSIILSCTPATEYQWYKNGNPLGGAIFQNLTVVSTGTYSVRATYSDNTTAMAEGLLVRRATTWSGSAGDGLWTTAANWSCGAVPTQSDHVLIEENALSTPLISEEFVVKAATIELGELAALTVNSGSTLKVTGEVKIHPTASFVIKTDGSLLQTNDVPNTGNLTMERTTAPMKKYDYTYWSSSVSGQTLYNLSPNTTPDKYYSYNPAIGNWVSHPNGNQVMEKGKGYIVRAPQDFSETQAESYLDGKFIGIPNNGMIEIPVSIGNSDMNLIGNPYPSALDLDLFLTNPTNADLIDGTVYLWTHNSAPAYIPGDATYNYTSNDYAAYNLLGGVGTSTEGNNEAPSGKVATGQGFFVKATAQGQLAFDNSMRVAFMNSQFFRSADSNTVQTIEKHRIWLSISNDQGAFKQALVGFVEGATNGTDRNFDGIAYNGNSFVNFYSISEDKHFTIQGRALPFNEYQPIPMGFSTTVAGTFTITLSQFDGLFDGQDVYLVDHLNDTVIDLKTGAYQFTTAAGTFNDRFEVKFTTEILAVDSFSQSNTFVLINKNSLQVKSSETMSSITIYDLAGRILKQNQNINAAFFESELNIDSPIFIVKIILENGKIISRKAVRG